MILIRSPVLKILYAITDTLPTDIPAEISEYRKSKILSKRTPRERSLATGAAILLKKALKSYGIEEKDIEYGSGEHGKPYFRSHPELRFSLSHSKNMVALAIDENDVGIDCEPLERRVTKELTERFFSEKEAEEFGNDPLTLWVTKESLCKLSGKGLLLGAGETLVPSYRSETVIGDTFVKRFELDGYVIVVSSKHEIRAVPEKVTLS